MVDIRYQAGDIVIEVGDIATVDEPDASGQRIADRLLTFRGEWFLDLDFGVPYREDILVKNPRVDVVSAVIKSEILKSVDGQFTAFEASLNNQTRKLTVAATLGTTAGEVAVNITV